MAVVFLWPMLAGLLAAGYFAWSASFAEWLYLKSVWLNTLEHTTRPQPSAHGRV